MALNDREDSIWAQLTKLFKNGPVVRHKIAASSKMYEPQGTAKAYKKELSSLYVNSLASYGQYERLARYCLDGDTEIATSRGFITIKELSEKYPEGNFYVYSYDAEAGKIVPAIASKAWKTKTDETVKIKFDRNKELVCTPDHPIMLRDGTCKEASALKPGDSCMPFYNKNFYRNGYRFLHDIKNGWISEHIMVAEYYAGRKCNDDEVVHHKDLDPTNNTPDNLVIMTKSDHSALHARINNEFRWKSKESRIKQSEFMKEWNKNYWNDETRAHHSKKAKEYFAKPGSKEKLSNSIKKVWEERYDELRPKIENFTSYWKGKTRPEEFKESRRGDKNSGWRSDLTIAAIEDAAVKSNFTQKETLKLLKCQNKILLRRIRSAGFSGWRDFSKKCKERVDDGVNNHKVISVEPAGIRDVFDIEVPKYHNFATRAILVHNSDYSEMEFTPEISSALDIYADEICSVDEKGHMINIETENEEIKEVLDTLFFDILNIEFNLHSWIRNLCKHGDFIMFVDASENNGILNLLPIPINEVEREEGYDPNNPFAFRFRWLTQGNMILEAWQIIHFRLLGNDNFLPYGSSIIEPARRVWRQLILIEDAMMIYRIVRSPERRVFKIEVGTVKPEEIPRYMEQVKNELKRNKIVNSETGRVDLRYNPLSVDEDYYLPMRDGVGSQIDTLPGGQFTGDIEDVEYIQAKMFAALKIPKSYLGYEGDVGSKATLAQEDVRFSRTIQRMQKIMVSELTKIAVIHLYLMGYRGEDLVDYEIKMSNPSTIAEQQKLELWRVKLEIAGSAQEGMLDKITVWKDLFGFSNQKIQEIQDGQRADKLFQLEIEGMTLEPDEAEGGEEGGEVAGEDDLPDTLGGEEPDEPDASGEEEELQASYHPENDDELTRSIRPMVLMDSDEEEDEDDLVSEEYEDEYEDEDGDESEEYDEYSVTEDGDDVKGYNPGSEGNQAEVSVFKGKNIFAPSENLYNHVFGTEKQAASDPYDIKSMNRMIRRPFSEDVDANEESTPISEYIKRSTKRILESEEKLPIISDIMREIRKQKKIL